MNFPTTDALTIRKATSNDLDEIVELFDSYRQFYEQPSDIASARVFLSARLTSEESVIFLACLESAPVGFVQLYPLFSSISMAKVWVLNDMFVIPEARGCGIATHLLREVEAFARGTRAKSILLETAPDNDSAQRLYRSNGYKLDDEFLHFSLSL